MLFKLIIKLFTPPLLLSAFLYIIVFQTYLFSLFNHAPPSPRAPVLKEVGRGAE